jgi:hypothetical protein
MSVNCENLVVKLATEKGLNLPEKHLRELTAEMDKQLKARKIRSPADMDAAFDTAFKNTSEKRIALRQMKKEELLRLKYTAAFDDFVKNYKGSNVKDDVKGFLVFLEGGYDLAEGSRKTLSNDISGTEDLFFSLFEQTMKKYDTKDAAIWPALESGEITSEIYTIAYEIEAGAKIDDVNASDLAKNAYKAITEYSEKIRERKNSGGAFIGQRADHLGGRTHDMKRIRLATEEVWTRDFFEFIDLEKTFGKTEVDSEIKAYVSELYKRFASGKHHLADEVSDESGFRVSTSNLARKISQRRSLHFKDAESALKYDEAYGQGNLWERLINNIQRDAREVALLEKLGPNPRATIEAVIKRIEKRAFEQGTSVDNAQLNKMRNVFDAVTGLNDIPESITMAEIGAGFRALESMSKLGAVVPAAFSDMGFGASTLARRTDMNFFGALIKQLTSVFGRMPKDDAEKVFKLFGGYSEVITGQAYYRMTGSEGMPGTLSRMQERFFRWNLLQWWTMRNKKALITTFVEELASHRGKSFDALPANTQRNLAAYSIFPEEWEIMRLGETQLEGSDRHYITRETIASIPDEKLDAVIALREGQLAIDDNIRQEYRDQLTSKLMAMASDIMDEGIVTPGAKERRMITFGQQKGTPLGEFIRMAGQFKAFPVTVITKQILPQYYTSGGGARGIMALMPMIVTSTALGYISGATKDLLKGREPKDPRDGRVMVDAMVRGGGLGLFGDFMFQEYSKYGRSFQETLLGPGIGTISDFAALAHKSATLNADAQDYFRFIKNVTPGQNLFYTEAAVNYLFYYNMMEALEPGFLRKMERKRMKEYEQDYWLSPSESSIGLFD